MLDQVDVFAMQNWEHVTTVLSHVNTQPLRPHGVDFSRVRMWALDKLSKYYRQTLVFSGVTGSPEVNSIFTKHCFNFCGRVRQVNPVVNGSICQVVNTSVPVVFRKFSACHLLSRRPLRFLRQEGDAGIRQRPQIQDAHLCALLLRLCQVWPLTQFYSVFFL